MLELVGRAPDDSDELGVEDQHDGHRRRQLSPHKAQEVLHVRTHVGEEQQVDEEHDGVDDGDVVDGPADEPRLVEMGPCLSHLEADLDTPQEEDDFAPRQGDVPPIEVALTELQLVEIRDVNGLKKGRDDLSHSFFILLTKKERSDGILNPSSYIV